MFYRQQHKYKNTRVQLPSPPPPPPPPPHTPPHPHHMHVLTHFCCKQIVTPTPNDTYYSTTPYLTMPSRTMPAAPTITPAFIMPQGRAKLPEPILAFTKLKNVATSLVEGRVTHTAYRHIQAYHEELSYILAQLNRVKTSHSSA